MEMGKRALITGGAGFIGSHLASRLVEGNWVVDIVDDMSNGSEHALPPHLRHDSLIINDFASQDVIKKIQSKEYEVIFHLAAQPRVGYSVDHPVDTNNTNVTKTLALLDACRGNIERFVFASSSAVYGNCVSLPTKEDCPKNPQSPYALQKLIVEDYLRLYGKLYDFDSVSLRFFNVFGPRQLGDSPYSTAVSSWLTSIMKKMSMRSDGDGTQTRDMVYVDNVVDALVLAAKHTSSLRGEAFNVGTGKSVSNNEILESLKSRFHDATSHSAPERIGDVKHTLSDLSKIRSTLGYGPGVDFWQGLERTVKWYVGSWKVYKDLTGK